MAQQQMLLLVLGIVIVGLSVVGGIHAFSENNYQANADVMVNDLLRIGSDLQAWSLKPELTLGGGGNLNTLANGTHFLDDAGFKLGTNNCSATEYGNNNACYALASTKAAGCVDEPIPPVDGGMDVYINGRSNETGNWVCMIISGTQPENIGTSVTYGT